jgi:hypothetical protein
MSDETADGYDTTPRCAGCDRRMDVRDEPWYAVLG